MPIVNTIVYDIEFVFLQIVIWKLNINRKYNANLASLTLITGQTVLCYWGFEDAEGFQGWRGPLPPNAPVRPDKT